MLISIDSHEILNKVGEEEGLALIREKGFEAVDYSIFNWDYNEHCLEGNYIKKAEQIRKILEKNGLVCEQSHSPYKKLTYESKLSMDNPDYADVIKSIEYAAVLGAKTIVIHCFGNPAGPESKECIEYDIKFYKQIEKYAKEFNIQISAENMITWCLRRPETTNITMAELDPKYFNFCFDTGHALVSGMAPEDYINGLNKGIMKYLHMQDNYGTLDNHLFPFSAHTNWDNVIKALVAYGYEGNINLEIPCVLQKVPKELIPSAVAYAADIANYLRNQFQALA